MSREEARARIAARQREVIARILYAMRQRGPEEQEARARLSDVEALDLEERYALAGLEARDELAHLPSVVFGLGR